MGRVEPVKIEKLKCKEVERIEDKTFSPQNVYVFETGKKICLAKLSQTKMEARGKNVASILELVF